MPNLLTLTADPLPESTHVVSLRGREALSTPYQFEIGLEINDPDFDIDSAIRARATLQIHAGEDRPAHTLHGILAVVEHLQQWQGKSLYRAILVPQLWDLSQTLHSRVFTDNTIIEIISAVLESSGLTADDYRFEIQESYPAREHVCQYKESNLAFVSRWMQREGLYYYFEQGDEREVLVITDHHATHVELGTAPVRYVPGSDADFMAADALAEFTYRRSALPATVALKDYDYLNPTLDVHGEADVATGGLGEIRMYGHNCQTPAEGKRLARVRAEALMAGQRLFHGRGRVFHIRPGYRFKLEEHPKGAFNTTYLTTAVEHFANQSATDAHIKRLLGLAGNDDLGVDEYGVAITAIDAGVQFRAPERTPWPRIYGYERATVCGEAESEYAQIDDHGRYNIRIGFDESDLVDGSASTWIRMLQPHGGVNEGFHFPLRKKTEVLLLFLGGDPDQPVVAGVVPNAHTPSPVTSANHTYNVIQTGGLNRLEMRDNEGTQHVRISTPPENTFIHLGRLNEQYNIHVETDGRALWRCGGDWHRIIDGERREQVKGDAMLYVTEGNHDVDIMAGERTDHVTGTVTETYDDLYWRDIGGDNWLDVAGVKWSDVVGDAWDDFHSDHKVTVDGSRTITVRTALTETVTAAVLHDYKANRELKVGGDCKVDVSSGKWDLKCVDKGETITGKWSWDCLGGHVKLTVDATSETLIGIKNENLIGGKIETLVGMKMEAMLALHLAVRAGAHLEMDGSVNLGETPCWLTTAGAKIESGATWISEKIMNIIL